MPSLLNYGKNHEIDEKWNEFCAEIKKIMQYV
jgi:hypothetical protein